MYRYIVSSLLSIPFIAKASTSENTANDGDMIVEDAAVAELDSIDLFDQLYDPGTPNAGDLGHDDAFNDDYLERLFQATMFDEITLPELMQKGPLTPEARAGFNMFDRPVLLMAGIPVEEPQMEVPLTLNAGEPSPVPATAATSSSSSRPPRSKPALRVDTTLAYRNPAPSSTGSSLTDISLSSGSSGSGETRSAASSRKRKSPQSGGIVQVMIDNPDMDLDGILSVLGDEAELQRSAVMKIMNLRLMPVMFMDIIDKMMKRNRSTLPSDIAKEIKRKVGIAPAYWISIWTENCFTPDKENLCLGLEKRMINLDTNSQIECFYMDTRRWFDVLNIRGSALESRGGVDLEIYLTALETRAVASSSSKSGHSERKPGKTRRLTEDTAPRGGRVATPELPESDIEESLAVQMQNNLNISPETVSEMIKSAGGNTEVKTVRSIKERIEKRFSVPNWLHKHILNNKDFSVEAIHDSLGRYLQNVTGGALLMREISIDRVGEWKKFCIDGDITSISTRCYETILNGQIVTVLSEQQKIRLLETL